MEDVAIVLGAGGPVGHAFHTGVLRALDDALGLDARRAALVLGTSAGAQVGALLRAGMTPRDLHARVTGEPMTEAGAAIARHWQRPSRDVPRTRPWRPASTRYLRRALRAPWRVRPGRFVSALLPPGEVCLKPQIEALRPVFGDAWPERALWITALCLHTGERLVFGSEDGPDGCVATAVAASGAVPSVCAPVEAGGRECIDGGLASPTHLDLLEGQGPSTVIVSSPLSMIGPMRLLLGREVRRLRAAGKRVIVVEPEGAAKEVMGTDPMDSRRAPAVAKVAHRTLRARFERDPLDQRSGMASPSQTMS